MNIEPTTPIEKAAYSLMQNPKSLMELIESCIEQEIIKINEESGVAYWYNSGDDLIDELDTLSDEDIRMIKYFWNEKGDLERWVGWDQVKSKCPEVVRAWETYQHTIKHLDWVVENVENLQKYE